MTKGRWESRGRWARWASVVAPLAAVGVLAACTSDDTGGGTGDGGTTGGSTSGTTAGTAGGTAGTNGATTGATAGTAGGTAGTNAGGQTVCNVVLSGAVRGSFPCILSAAYSAQDNAGAISISHSTAPTVSIGITTTGEPAVRTYSETDAEVNGGVSVVDATNKAWSAAKSDSSPAEGTFALTLTSVTETVNTGGAKVYRAKGSFQATLNPVTASGAAGTVTASVTFE